MKRVIVIVLDSLGIGYSKDSEKFGDKGANTLGHILKETNFGSLKNDFPSGFDLPNLKKLGLINALVNSSEEELSFLTLEEEPIALYGYAEEISKGKDTPSGHWEIMGLPVEFGWGYFSKLQNSFEKDITDRILEKAGLKKDYYGNCHASGTEIIKQYGLKHMQTGKPIFYTSADSVFQIAAHEETFGLENLYKLCAVAREELYQYNIGRIIARPFVGDSPKNFERTKNRRDYSIKPHGETLLDILKKNGKQVISIGKIYDIFAGKGITRSIKGGYLEENLQETLKILQATREEGLVFINFVDFDSKYGHRRDTKGYAQALQYFDNNLPNILELLHTDDLLVITADHGCDPTWQGSDHTREHIPIIFYQKGKKGRNIGKRKTFSDIGQSIARFFNNIDLKSGDSFL